MVLHAYSGTTMSSLVPNIRVQPDCAGKASLPPCMSAIFPVRLQKSLSYHIAMSLRPQVSVRQKVGQRAHSLHMPVCCRLSTTTKRLVLQHKRQRYAYKREGAALTPTFAWKDQPCISTIANLWY